MGGPLAAGLIGLAWLDVLVAAAFCVWILVEGSRLVRVAVDGLMDKADPRAEKAFRGVLETICPPRGLRFHRLRTRRSGRRTYADLHLQFAPGTALEEAHATASEVERALARAWPGSDVITHLEPARVHARDRE